MDYFRPSFWMYHLLPGVEPDDNNALDLRGHANSDFLTTLQKNTRRRIAPPTDFQSTVRSGLAFLYSAVSDIVSALLSPKKMKRWVKAFDQFDAYLETSGVGGELKEAFAKPMLGGRLFVNMKILNDVQEKTVGSRYEGVKTKEKGEIENEIKQGQRIMRFATAAYGTEMIKSAIDRVAEEHELDNTKKAIAFHTDIPEEDIKLVFVNDGGDIGVLRHFVCLDRKTKSVVLAIRGTLSISGGLVDMQAMDCEYCCGRAHKGIAEMAERLWDESGPLITSLLAQDECSGFNFTITGHSLGAGAACLLHIKCYVEDLLPRDCVVSCFGFAPPPVFCLNEVAQYDDDTVSRVRSAVENCVCYVNDNDCVPHLSIPSIRKLARELDIIDDVTSKMWFWRRFRIFFEWEGLPEGIEESLVTTRELRMEKVVGESNMVIPAKLVVWTKKEFCGECARDWELSETIGEVRYFFV